MLSFNEYLTEDTKPAESGHVKHITHPEDEHLIHGQAGYKHAVGALTQAHGHITKGKKDSSMTTKYDGSPAVVFGHHPKTGKFFVATKSAFNKTPKINYTHDDIKANHGHSPGLADKLHHALEHLPKVAPKKGVYQGDMMFSHGDVKHNTNGSASFKPNTINYTAHGAEANRVKNAKVGIVVHQKYHGRDIADMKSSPDVDRENFKRHPHVWNKSPSHDSSSTNYSARDQLEFKKHMDAAHDIHTKNKDMYKATEPHQGEAGHLASYANHMVRSGETPSSRGLQQHIIDKSEKAAAKFKTVAKQNEVKNKSKEDVSHIQSNRKHYDNLLKMHHHLQKAKNVLVNTLDQHKGGLTHDIEGKETSPEGYVVNHKNKLSKLVNRSEFAKANFNRNRK